MFCIYKTDPAWISAVRTLPSDVMVNFWRRGTNDFKLPIGSWLYFNQRRTRHVVGRGLLVEYGIHSIKQAWTLYGEGNGAKSLEALQSSALRVLGVPSVDKDIGCIVLSELEFLTPRLRYNLSEGEYSKNIVGPKYFGSTELPELSRAFSSSDNDPLTIREGSTTEYIEGNQSFSYRKGYERNSEAREASLAHHGFRCMACNSLLEEVYGAVARRFIHVHHRTLISKSDGAHLVNPVEDLAPMCPNCHAVAHRRIPPFSIEEIKEMIRLQND